ncbi:MAG: hypothetical protein HQL51_03455 [Magnetococcales bacterium]|nr:hypothetical protein [Magnetococcales bacterium]
MADNPRLYGSQLRMGGALRVRPVTFAEVIEQEKTPEQAGFQRITANGRPPAKAPVKKEPDISLDEIHRRRLEQIEREAFRRASEAGEKAGLAIGEQKMALEISRLLPRMESVLSELDQLPLRIFEDAERMLVETAIVLVKSLLKHELLINPDGLAERVREILEQAAGRKEVVVRLAPEEANLLNDMPEFKQLRIESDPSVSPGSVRLESDFGGVENDIHRQLARVEDAIRQFFEAHALEVRSQRQSGRTSLALTEEDRSASPPSS